MALPAPDPGLDRQLLQPLLAQLSQAAARARAGAGRQVLALNGPVGAGKSTLAAQLLERALSRQLRLAVASIDDFYLPWERRQAALAGNPFGVSRVPPGSHDVALALEVLAAWQAGAALVLPRFDKTLRGGQGDRAGERRLEADVLLLEGWCLGCAPVDQAELARLLRAPAPQPGPQPARRAEPQSGLPEALLLENLAALSPQERQWLPHWNRQLAAYQPLWQRLDQLWLLRPRHWGLPRRWRLQAEARQRRRGGAWLATQDLDRLVRSSLASLPPALYQEPLLRRASGWAELDGRRRCIRAGGPLLPQTHEAAQLSPSSSASSTG